MIKHTNYCLIILFCCLIIVAATACNKKPLPVDPQSCIDMNCRAKTESCLVEFIKQNPENNKAYFILGDFYANNYKDYEKTIKVFESGLVAIPNDELLLILSGEAHIKAKKIDTAIEIFKKTTVLYPKSGQAFFDLGCAYLEKIYECQKNQNPYPTKGYARQAYEAFEKARPLAPQYTSKINYATKALDKFLRS